jgi:hypothetical protein
MATQKTPTLLAATYDLLRASASNLGTSAGAGNGMAVFSNNMPLIITVGRRRAK